MNQKPVKKETETETENPFVRLYLEILKEQNYKAHIYGFLGNKNTLQLQLRL